MNGQIADGHRGIGFPPGGSKGQLGQLLRCQNITGPQHPLPQGHRPGFPVGQVGDADTGKVFSAEILRREAVNVIAVHLRGGCGNRKAQAAAKGRKSR